MGVTIDPASGAVIDDGVYAPPDVPTDLTQALPVMGVDGPVVAPPPAQDPLSGAVAADAAPLDVTTILNGFEESEQQAGQPSQLEQLRAAMRPGSPDSALQPDAVSGAAPGPGTGAPTGEPGATPQDGTLVSGVRQSSGSSESGYDSGKAGEVMAANDSAGLGQSRFQQERDRIDAESDARMAENQAALDANLAAIEKRRLADEELANAQMRDDVQHRLDLASQRADFDRKMANNEAIAEASKQRFLTSRAQAMAMVNDPYADLKNNKALAAFGVLGATLAANMGPGSIQQIDFQSMIGDMVDRAAKTQAIDRSQAWKLAETDDALWALARDGADDIVEADLRYRGFLTDAAAQQAKVTALKFAGSQAQAAYAAAEAAAVSSASQTADAIRKDAADRGYRLLQQEVEIQKSVNDNARMVQTARISQGPAWYNAETNRMEAKTRAKAAADEQLLFIDPTDPSRVLGVAQNPDAYKDGKAKLLGATGVARAVVAMQALEKDVKAKFNNGVLDAVSKNQATIDFDAVYNDLVSSVIRARTGAAATEKEREDLKTLFPRETILTSLLSGSLDFAQTWGQSASREIQSAKDSLVMSSRLGTSNADGALPEHTTALGVSATAGERKPDNTIPTLISGGSGKIKGNARNPAMFMPVTIPSISSEVFDVLDVHKDRDMVMRGVPRPSTNMLEGDIQEEIGRDHPDNHGGVGADVPAYVANLYTLWLLTASPDEATAKRASDGLDEAARGEPEAASKARAFKTLGVPDEAELRNLRNTRTVWSGPLRDALVKGRLLEE